MAFQNKLSNISRKPFEIITMFTGFF